MAIIVEFYVPLKYKPKKVQWVLPSQRGKILQFVKKGN